MYMRLLATLVLVFAFHQSVVAESPQDADKIDARLLEILDATAEDQLVKVSVVMAEQTPRAVIDTAAQNPIKADRRAAVIAALKETANRTQADVLQYLSAKQTEGRSGGHIRKLWLHNVIGVEVTPDVVFELAARADIARINDNATIGMEVLPVLPRANNDVRQGGTTTAIECGVDLMGAPQVWSQLGITGTNSVVCVIDTGICTTHPDLANQIWVNTGEVPGNGVDDDGNGFVDDINGWSFEDNSNNIADSNGHGTHVSGTVVGDGTNGEQTGMAPDAKVMTSKFLNAFTGEQSVWDGMQYAVDNGADVITASLGWPHSLDPDRTTWRNVCDNAIAAGVVVVYAAGNESGGNEPDNVRTPGDVPDVITVGATDCSDNLAGFSSLGPVTWEDVSPWFDFPFPPGLIKPTIAAPGVSTLSTSSNCSGYTTLSGTSMATPHIAGCIALMLDANPELDHFEVRQILQDTALDLGTAGNDNQFGWGRVDAFAAVEEALSLVSTIDFDFPNGLPTIVDPAGGTVVRVVAVDNGEAPQPGTGTLYYDIGNGFQSVAMNVVGTNVYDAVLPAAPCNTEIDYYFSVDSTAGGTYNSPRSAPSNFYSALSVGSITAAFADDCESDLGWTISGNATDGQWDRGVPVGGGDRGDPANDGDNSGACYLTDNVDGNSDVDGGATTLTSPTMDASASTSSIAMLSYYRWYSNASGAGPNEDIFEVEISNDNGATWVDLETVGPAGAGTDGGWILQSFTIADFVTPTAQMRVRFTASDLGDGSVIEAGVDGIKIEIVDCGGGTETVAPSAYTTFRGEYLSGGVADLADSDDSYVKHNPGFTLNNIEAPIWLIFDASLSNDGPASLDFAIEVSANTPGITQTTEAYNWNTSQYEVVDSQSSSFNTDAVISVDLSGSAGDYVEAGTGGVRTRAGWRKTGFTILFPWTICVDQVVWNAGN